MSAGYANGTNCCYDYCAKWLDLSTGTLTSPNYPNNYDPNTVCGWHLVVQENKVITLEINSFQASFTFIKIDPQQISLILYTLYFSSD